MKVSIEESNVTFTEGLMITARSNTQKYSIFPSISCKQFLSVTFLFVFLEIFERLESNSIYCIYKKQQLLHKYITHKI